MQYYDLLSSDQRERILTEQLLDRMEEAEEIQNSGPTGYARHDDDDDDYDYEEQNRYEEERERERERPVHKPYGHRFRSKEEPRRVGYGQKCNYNRDNKTTCQKSYGCKTAHSRSNSSDSHDNNQNNKNTLHKSYACRSARRNRNKPHIPYAKGRPNYKTRRPPR